MATVNQRNALATAYGARATHGALYSTAPTSTAAGTEISGGSPAYARKPVGWGTAASGAVSGSAVFDVASGTTVRGAGLHTALSGGEYADGVGVPDQPFASQGTYTVVYTYTQS